MKAMKLNKTCLNSLNIYADGLRDAIEMKYSKKKGRPTMLQVIIDIEDYPKLEHDRDVQWLVGWIAGVAESQGVRPERLLESVKVKA